MIAKPGIPEPGIPDLESRTCDLPSSHAERTAVTPVAGPPAALPPLALPAFIPARAVPTAPPAAPPPATSAEAYPGSMDLDALTKNFARLVEEGGRAVAAYLKPREDGAKKVGYSDEINDAVKTLGQVAGILVRRPPARRRDADAARQELSRPVGERGTAPGRRAHRAGRHARSARQALQGPRMVVEPVLRFPQAGLSASPPTGPGTSSKTRASSNPRPDRRRSSTCASSSTRASPSNFVFTNPELLRTTLRENAENLVRGSHMLAEDIEAGGGELQDQAVRRLEVRGRPQSRGLARQGGLSERADAAHPVRAGDRDGAAAPAADRAALDQQVLRARSRRRRNRSSNGASITGSRCSASHGSIRTSISPRRASPTTCARARLRRSTPSAGSPARREVNAVGYCVGGTLLADHARLYGGHGRPPHRLARRSSPPRSTSPMRATSRCSRPPRSRSVGRARDGRARLSRRREDGDRLQPAALQRPDLALCGQQLPQGQGAVPVRPVVLEFRRDPHAGRQSLVLPAQLLPREQPHQGGRWRSTASASTSARSRRRSTISPHARTTSRRRDRSSRLVLFRRTDALVLSGSGHIAGVVNPPAQDEVPVLDRRRRPRATTSTPGCKKATEHPGSWWPDWLAWIKAQDSAEVPARQPGGGVVAPIEDAPGSYVKVRS